MDPDATKQVIDATKLATYYTAEEAWMSMPQEEFLRGRQSLVDDIDDRINREFMSPPVGITAQGRTGLGGFRIIPEE